MQSDSLPDRLAIRRWCPSRTLSALRGVVTAAQAFVLLILLIILLTGAAAVLGALVFGALMLPAIAALGGVVHTLL